MKQYLSFENSAIRSLFVNTLANSGFTFANMNCCHSEDGEAILEFSEVKHQKLPRIEIAHIFHSEDWHLGDYDAEAERKREEFRKTHKVVKEEYCTEAKRYDIYYQV